MTNHRAVVDKLTEMRANPDWEDHFFYQPLSGRAIIATWPGPGELVPSHSLKDRPFLWAFKFLYAAISERAKTDLRISCPDGWRVRLFGNDSLKPAELIQIRLMIPSGQRHSERPCCEIAGDARKVRGTLRFKIDVVASLGETEVILDGTLDLTP